MVEQIKKFVTGTGTSPETAFFKRGLFSSEFLLLLIFLIGIYANYAWLDGKVPEKTIDLIGLYVGGWTGLRQIGKLSAASPTSTEKQ